MDTQNIRIALAEGDGIGPEIVAAVRSIIEATGAPITWVPVRVGKAVYEEGHTSGVAPESWDAIRETGVLLKGPITTPQGGGYKSVNVTLRKSLGLYANVRPCVAYSPFVPTRHPRMDLVIVRENEEDLYAGIEHQQTDDVVQCLKLITRPGCEKIVRYAFEYAAQNGRKHVTCMTKDNIMKLTDGLFHRVFNEVALEYPDITVDHQIIDIGAARLADSPERFDVIVTSNLYGDIISDIAAQVAGSVGLAPSANIGERGAMFEAIHGSAPDIAGKGIANPSGLLLAAVQMLVHLGLPEPATAIHNAWLRTIEEGIHTTDIYRAESSREHVGTMAFADAVRIRLGMSPSLLTPVHYAASNGRVEMAPARPEAPAALKEVVGMDVFVHARGVAPDALAAGLQTVSTGRLALQMITNRGVKVWPQGLPETFLTDHWRCRFVAPEGSEPVRHGELVALLGALDSAGVDFIKTENLCRFDGVAGYSAGQGQ
jgi:isocitrate dehydrogenase